ncbi:hypothetical protein Tco_0158980 [Tanacetum coccineum]
MAEEDALLVDNVEGGLCVDYTDAGIVERCNSGSNKDKGKVEHVTTFAGHYIEWFLSSKEIRWFQPRTLIWMWKCVKTGAHFRGDCRSGNKKNANAGGSGKGSKDHSQDQGQNLVDAIAWWIDSGATTHVCKDRCWFKTYEPVEDGSVLYMGDDHFTPVHGKGCVVMCLVGVVLGYVVCLGVVESSLGKSITLFNVLYVPKLRKNLISGPDLVIITMVVESCTQLISELGELDVSDENGRASILECLTTFWEDFTCHKTILQVASNYLESDISKCLSQLLALGTKVLLDMLSHSAAVLSALARRPVSTGKELMSAVETFILELFTRTKDSILEAKLFRAQLGHKHKCQFLDWLFSDITTSSFVLKDDKLMDTIFSLTCASMHESKLLLLGHVALFVNLLRSAPDLEDDVKLEIPKKLEWLLNVLIDEDVYVGDFSVINGHLGNDDLLETNENFILCLDTS